jgi:Fe-S cluster assembly protein SufD
MSTSVIFKPKDALSLVDSYLADLLTQCEGNFPVIDAPWLQELRQKAASQVVQLNLPGKRDEEWRFTDLSDLLKQSFQVAPATPVTLAQAQQFFLPETNQSRLVFVNGFYRPELSDTSALPAGVYVGNLQGQSISQNGKFVKYLAQEKSAKEVFTALNTAGLTDVAVIWAQANVTVATPIQLLFLSVATDSPTFSQPRGLIVAETGSSLQLVEYYGAIAEGCSDFPKNRPYFTNTVTEIWLEDNAQVNHSRIQRESGDGFHLGKTAIAQSRNSHYTCNEVSLGGKLYRHNLQVLQTGEQTETYLNGLTMIGGEQLADTHSVVSLNKPYGTVNQLHKCIADGKAHAIFNGKIFVPQGAQMTNAAQLNRNLVLSPQARVNTKPELQITADNVKCSHGATVSQLEADEIFYLRSRGLTENDARHLLIDAFAADILQRLPLESLRHRLTQCVACRTMD